MPSAGKTRWNTFFFYQLTLYSTETVYTLKAWLDHIWSRLDFIPINQQYGLKMTIGEFGAKEFVGATKVSKKRLKALKSTATQIHLAWLQLSLRICKQFWFKLRFNFLTHWIKLVYMKSLSTSTYTIINSNYFAVDKEKIVKKKFLNKSILFNNLLVPIPRSFSTLLEKHNNNKVKNFIPYSLIICTDYFHFKHLNQ